MARHEAARRIAELLRDKRALEGTHGEAIARQLGVSYRAYQRWEGGANMPRDHNLQRIADYLVVSRQELLGMAKPTPTRIDLEAILARIEAKLDVVLAMTPEEWAQRQAERYREAELIPPETEEEPPASESPPGES